MVVLLMALFVEDAAALLTRVTQLEGALLQTRQHVQQTHGPRSLVDTKLLSKPKVFEGSQETWSDWAFVFRAYTAALASGLSTLMAKASDTDDDLEALRTCGDNEALDSQLYYILALSCQGRALEKLRSCPESRGLEVWRAFHQEWEPRQRARFTAMLTGLLRATFSDPLISAIEQWERTIKNYEEQSGETMPDSIKASVLTAGVANDRIREHLMLNAGRLLKYDDIRAEVVRIAQAQRTWTPSSPQPGQPNQGSAPMEVDAIKGKKGGKGKKGDAKGKKGEAKGKGTWNSDGKGKKAETRECRYCHKVGHLEIDCRKKQRDEKKEGKRVAAIGDTFVAQPLGAQPGGLQDTQFVAPSSSSLSTASTVGCRALLPDYAGGAALLAQQALQVRQQQSRQSISLCALVDVPAWPDTDDEIGICMLGPASPVAGCTADEVWALWDSGSGLTTCPVGFSQKVGGRVRSNFPG